MALKERLSLPAEAKTWPGELPVQSLYTAGAAGDRFFKTLKEKGQFQGAVCTACNEVYVPPKLYCEKCMAKLDDWVKVGPTGIVESWTELHVGLDGKPLEKPQFIGLIRLDGATTSIVHRLTEKPCCIGMEVAAVLKPTAKREGAITDILHFEPK
ncbi:Zn-ribbon domain-containing OB-fold protein [candidate division WOR-3 bacterium]|uniref:Zn-ribbon domain-containing OB-fold protein n=1 Tax=candidate division WOR-3 bacterium TaxID=2052148 RepID=A0A938BS82_UNCW3|nr:Zn-ribbon domain-containing OB-fold protein [candidate division WOR-3 bacterium]